MEATDRGAYAEGIWRYFEFHASQRLTTFNFYIVISTLLATGLFFTYQQGFGYPLLRVGIGAILTVLTFAFWKLDARNRFLISIAERALRDLEHKHDLSPDPEGGPSRLAIFTREKWESEMLKSENTAKFWRVNLSYRQCLAIVFASFAIAGAMGAIDGARALLCAE